MVKIADEIPTVDADVHAGQAIYIPLVLNLYDLVVLGLSTNYIWECPTRELVNHYDRHVSSNHLDVGVGTGYLLDRCRFPTGSPRLFLMDMNPHTLTHASRRVDRYRPETLRRNVLAPIAFDGEPFDSVGMSFLLHCLPGSIPEKALVFDHLKPLIKPGGLIFGSTILSLGVERTRIAVGLMGLYNKYRTFSNAHDSLADLRRALEARFSDVEIRTSGSVALFSARRRA